MLGHELRNPLAPIVNARHVLDAGGATAGDRELARDHRAPGRASDAAGRRPARRLAHHARQDRAAAASRSTSPTSSPTRSRCAASRGRQSGASTPSSSTCRASRCASTATRPAWRRWSPTCSTTRPSTRRRAGDRASRATRDGGSRCSRRDTDVGIGPSLLCARIFEPFVQGGGRVDRARGGLGLGLTLVRASCRAARRHGRRCTAAARFAAAKFEVRLRLTELDASQRWPRRARPG